MELFFGESVQSCSSKTVQLSLALTFDRTPIRPVTTPTQKNVPIETIKKVTPKKESVPDNFFKASKTAKLSHDVLLRLNTLKPFIEELENTDKSTVNDMMQMFIECYVNTRLTTRQREGYTQMYSHLF